MPNLKDFLEKVKRKQMKKGDWLLLALAGVLLLVIVLPMDTGKVSSGEEQETLSGREAAPLADTNSRSYAAELEKKLENVLKKTEGVGDVKVMITVEDNGENVVEKDAARNTSTTTEEDSDGGSRQVNESSQSTSTVYVEEGSGKYPYVQKEMLPIIKGVVVVAEGGEDTRVKTEITEAVEALFPVEAHRIKVLAMSRKN